MASTGIMALNNSRLLSFPSAKCSKNQILPLKPSQFLSRNSLSMLKKKQQIQFPSLHLKQLKNQKIPTISAARSEFKEDSLTHSIPERDSIRDGDEKQKCGTLENEENQRQSGRSRNLGYYGQIIWRAGKYVVKAGVKWVLVAVLALITIIVAILFTVWFTIFAVLLIVFMAILALVRPELVKKVREELTDLDVHVLLKELKKQMKVYE